MPKPPVSYYLKPVFQRRGVTLYRGDCRDVLPHLSGITAVVTDPPYGLEFMGREWDKLGAHANARTKRAAEIDDPSKGRYIRFGVNSYGNKPHVMQAWFHEMFTAILAACKPGAPLLAFGGTRTYHRLTCAIEDAGWEVRDCMMWLYGSGFPKSLDVSKAIDKAAGAKRKVVGKTESIQFREQGRKTNYTVHSEDSGYGTSKSFGHGVDITAPATDGAKQWDGYGTALKPAFEPILLCRKPLTAVPVDGRLLVGTQHLLGGLLCLLLSNASNAKRFSRFSPNVSGEACASALMLAAVLRGNKSNGLSGATATSSSPEVGLMCLNIAKSWSSILAVVLSGGSTFTTETVTSLTTALQTLSCLLSTSIPAEVIRAVSRPLGLPSNAMAAERNLSVGERSKKSIRGAFARALASLKQGGSGTDVKNVVRTLRLMIPSVDSVLNHALQRLIIESGIPVSSENVSIAEGDSVQSALGPLSTADESAWLPGILKPDYRPICVAMKPLEGTFAQNALKHGVAGINVDGGRIGSQTRINQAAGNKPGGASLQMSAVGMPQDAESRIATGRWPANVLLQHHSECVQVGVKRVKGNPLEPYTRSVEQRKSQAANHKHVTSRGHADADGLETVEQWECHEDCPVGILDRQSGVSKSTVIPHNPKPAQRRGEALQLNTGKSAWIDGLGGGYTDTGGASRFFYCAKASKKERTMGGRVDNKHPTVKPLKLMEYLLTLVTMPEENLVLDPFCGSGSTLLACASLGLPCIGIEKDWESAKTAVERLECLE